MGEEAGGNPHKPPGPANPRPSPILVGCPDTIDFRGTVQAPFHDRGICHVTYTLPGVDGGAGPDPGGGPGLLGATTARPEAHPQFAARQQSTAGSAADDGASAGGESRDPAADLAPQPHPPGAAGAARA